jgi:endonuclease VIII
VPEGDTIHRIADRLGSLLGGVTLERAEAPNPRSPLHSRADELAGATLERAEARGKHLLLHLDRNRVIHNHLGMNGRWRIGEDSSPPGGRPWLLLAAAGAHAALSGGKLLRLTTASGARNDPVLLGLGPDPLAPDFDEAEAAGRLLAWEPSAELGAALLDQTLIAGIGNVIRIEALFGAGVSPWRRVGELSGDESIAIVREGRAVMATTVRTGRRPKRIYGHRANRPCPRCGGSIRTARQGDDARVTYWCEGCQR